MNYILGSVRQLMLTMAKEFNNNKVGKKWYESTAIAKKLIKNLVPQITANVQIWALAT